MPETDRLGTPLPWIGPNDPLPDPRGAWRDPNGLLAAGAGLSPSRLFEAYSRGIFPWYSDGQPVLWWSPDPRMVLYLDEFRLHRSLGKTIRRNRRDASLRVTLNRCFDTVMQACGADREADGGTWITTEMRAAYQGLHRLGHAHSIEVWGLDAAAETGPDPLAQPRGEVLVGGLYGVAIGRMFFGESMFSRATDASKIALASLVQTLIRLDFRVIDCQQNTRHLASLGAREISRAVFLDEVADLIRQPGPDWRGIGIELPDA